MRPTHWAATGHNSTVDVGSGGWRVEERGEKQSKAKQTKQAQILSDQQRNNNKTTTTNQYSLPTGSRQRTLYT